MMRKIISLMVILLIVGVNTLDAQSPTVSSLRGGRLPEWSSNSQIFVYQDVAKQFPHVTHTPNEIFMAAPYWDAFDPQTGNVAESNIWPLYPDLNSAERNLYQTEDFIRTSPDGEIFIYGSMKGKLVLANRETQQIFETDIDYEAPNVLPIWWSEDGQGVAIHGAGISPYVADPIVYYLRLRDRSDLTQTEIYSVQWTKLMVVGDREFMPVDLERILDVHQHQVLTTMSDITNHGKAEIGSKNAQSYLVIWNPEHPETSTIIDAFDGGSLRGAAFVPDDPQRLLIILGNGNIGVPQYSNVREGLYTYNIQTYDLQFLSSLDGYNVDLPLFSPDGNWLALSVNRTGNYDFFRTSNLLTMTPLSRPTAFPTFTPPPTYIPTAVTTKTPTG